MKQLEQKFFLSILGIVTIIHLYAYRVWLFSSGILTQGDWMVSLPNYSKSLLSLPIIWKSYSMGSIDLTPPFYAFLLLQGFLANLNVSYAFIERITFMWPIALFTIPFTYLFIRSFIKNNIAALVGALVYAYNTYFIILQSGHLTLMSGFAFAPIVLLCFKNALEKSSWFYSVLAGLFAFFISYFEFRAFYLVTLICLFYYLYHLFVIAESKISLTLKKTILHAFIPLIIVVVLNIYWILPYLKATVSINGAVFDRELFGKELFNLSRAITLFHPFWTGDKYFPFIPQPIPPTFFLLPIFAFLGLYLQRKSKYVLFYGLLSLLGIFLVKQNNAPFPDVYVWLYAHFPGFGAFREASKFYFFVALGYAVLISAFVDWIWSNWHKSYLLLCKYILIVIIIVLSVWNLKTLILGTFGTLFVERSMPAEYLTVNDFIDQQNSFYRTLWVPTGSRWGTNTDLHPKEGLAESLSGFWKRFSDGTKYKSLGDQYITFYRLPYSQELLNTASIKYVIVPLADYANDDNFFSLFGKSRKDFIESLDKTYYLHKISSSQHKIAIYENTSYRPHLYLTHEKESLYKSMTFQPVTFIRKNNSQFTVTIKNIKRPFYLQFTESYHPDWRLHAGKFHWYGTLLNKNYFLPQNIHEKNVAGFNSFYIDPEQIKNQLKSDQYKINNDGTMDIDLTLYFVPQTYSYIGICISGLAMVITLSYILIYCYRNYGKK